MSTLATYLLTALVILCCAAVSFGQAVSGRITNEYGEPVPYANVFVKELGTGALSDDEGRYTITFRVDGSYELVFSSLGYEGRTMTINLELEPTELNVTLLTSGVELEEITVSASGRDPAYGIIKEAIARKREHLADMGTYRTTVYVKAVEEIDRLRAAKAAPPVSIAPATPPDPLAVPEEDAALLDGLNMVEMQLRLNFAYPKQYKEERTAYREYGDVRGLFLPEFSSTDFNFYRNMVALPGISQAPVISPLSNTSVLTYRFALEASEVEHGQLVYRIRVTPRKTGNSTVDGLLWINAEEYTINRLDVAFPEGSLVFSDEFALRQTYRKVGERWMVGEQVFTYATKEGKKRHYRGSTVLSYSDYEPDYAFPDKFFGNEVAVITEEAYERDSTYWKAGRTVALTDEEARLVHLRDSIRAVTSSQRYQDSITQLYNKITFLDLAFDGVGFRNNRQQSHLYFGPVTSMVDFSPVGGWRVGPYVATHRRFENGREMDVSGSLDLGLKNLDLQGKVNAWYRYDPFHLGDVSMWVGRDFESFNPNDAYLNQLKASNYFLKNELAVGQSRELLNGLYLKSNVRWIDRKPISGYDTENLLNGIIGDETPTIDFEGYQALITNVYLNYTPGQRYMREPNRKVVLGSKWPTFSLLHRRGWSGALSSDIRFDYLEFAVQQEVQIGALGRSTYRAQVGQFVNTEDLRFVDIKRFRDSDPLLYSDPLTTFQSLNAALATDQLHAEVHYIHRFNGALINNVPLLKKTRIQAVAGGGALWLQEDNFRYQELLAGIERVFKLGARRRVRLGLYGVAADSNKGEGSMAYKVSFDLIDIWKRDWTR